MPESISSHSRPIKKLSDKFLDLTNTFETFSCVELARLWQTNVVYLLHQAQSPYFRQSLIIEKQ